MMTGKAGRRPLSEIGRKSVHPKIDSICVLVGK